MSKKEKEFVKEITPMEEDFSRWYTDVIMKNELVDYSPCLLYTSHTIITFCHYYE